MKDLLIVDNEKKLIRAIDENTFTKHPINLIKAISLMTEYEYDLDEDTKNSIIENGNGIKDADPIEIREELYKILRNRRTYFYFNIMDRHLNILNKIFPEIEPMKEVGRCKYHVVDSWTHSLYTLNIAESIIYADGYFESHLRKAYENHTCQPLCHGHTRLELIKLAALFHDIGKPGARRVDHGGRVRFKGHETLGAEMVETIADRLRFCDKEKEFLSMLVREHMWPLTLYKNNDVSGESLYNLFKRFGENTLDVLLVSLADIIATRKLLYPHEEMGMYKVHIEYLANNYLTRFKDIINISHVITREDIEETFDIRSKEWIDQLIDSTRKAIFFGKIPPEKKRALAFLKEELSRF